MSKIRFIKLQSANDRKEGSLSSFTVDLTDASYLQNVQAVQLVSAGFNNTTPNVQEGENTIVFKTSADLVDFPPGIPEFLVQVFDASPAPTLITVQSPPPGTYTIADWATAIKTNINAAISDPAAVLEITTINSPPTLQWNITDPTSVYMVEFNPAGAIAPYLGIDAANKEVLGQLRPGYTGPLFTFPPAFYQAYIVNNAITVPAGQYTINELIIALNAVAPSPSGFSVVWAFDTVNNIVNVAGTERFIISSVIDNKQSTLAPLLGFHYDHPPSLNGSADTVPGLSGVLNAYIHIRPIASLNTVAVSSRDGRALQASILGMIPLANVPFGQYTQREFDDSGETFLMRYDDRDRDISRFQVRLRDHAGRLLQIGNPGVVLMLKAFLR